MANFGVQMAKSMGALGVAGPAAAEAVPGASLPGLGGMGGMLGGGGVGSPISAGLGNEASLGKLSVPSSWAGTTPAPSTAPVSVEGLAPASPETGGPETCWAACRWPAARASARPTPVLDTGFAPP